MAQGATVQVAAAPETPTAAWALFRGDAARRGSRPAMKVARLRPLWRASVGPVVASPVLFAIVAFFAGTLIAPSIASQSVLVSRLAPSHYATEAFTWSTTFIVAGSMTLYFSPSL